MTYLNSPVPQPEQSERDPLIAFARHWWWLLLIGAIIGCAAAVAYARVGPILYESTSLVQVVPPTGDAATVNAEQARSAALNFSAEVLSPRIYALVSEDLKGSLDIQASDLEDMERNGTLTASAARTSNFIRIVVSDLDPERARLLADTIARVFVEDITARANIGFEARQTQLEEQIQFTRQQLATAALRQREIDLEAQLNSQQSTFLTLQASYQQELARQVEADALSDHSAFSENETTQQSEVRTQLLRVIGEQISDVEINITSLNENLDRVRTELASLPQDSDGSLSAAFATAYSLQLSALTQQYVTDQIAAVTESVPVVRYGDASTPFAAQKWKKLAMFGTMAGLAVSASIGFAVDQARKWRNARTGRAELHDKNPGWNAADPDLVHLIAMIDKLQARGDAHNDHMVGTVGPRAAGQTVAGE